MGNSVLDGEGIDLLAKAIANVKAMRFLYWFTYSENTIEIRVRRNHINSLEKIF